MDSKMIEKEFDRYFEKLLNEPHENKNFIEIRNKGLIGIKGSIKMAFQACATLMSDRVKELEAENKNNLKLLQKCGRDLQCQEDEISDLQSKLDEAVEIIKTISKNANHYDKIDLQNKAEQFLSSLDKTKEEL